ncbi:MAG: hypothetical protein RJB36_18 [Bacteroidota bacterium]|jgi:hypothetical protein
MSGYIDIFEKDYQESRSEVKRSLIYTSISLLLLFILLVLTHFNILPAIPEDVPPLKSDEVIELFEMDVALIPEESGSRGGGTSSQGPIDQPQDQTERVATSHSSDFSSTNGRSNNHNTNNSNNPTSSTHHSTNYFGSGGNGGNGGSGNGPFGGPNNGADNGPGNGPGSGKTPTLYGNIGGLAKVYTDQIDVTSRVGLIVTLNAEGKITDCKNIKSVTTCKSQAVINEVIRLVKLKMYGNKDPGAPLRTISYTVAVNPT